MSWSFQVRAPDGAYEAEVKRAFDAAREQQKDSPEARRALSAIEAFVREAPKNIPEGVTVLVSTHGHLDTAGRGSLQVSVEIWNTPAPVVEEASPAAVTAPPGETDVAALFLTPDVLELTPRKRKELTAHPQNAAGNTVRERTIEWASSDEDVATVSADGVVHARALGECTITATCEGQQGTARVVVEPE